MCIEKQRKLNNTLSAVLSRNVRYLSVAHDRVERGRYVVLMRYARSVIEIRATRGEMDMDLSMASLVSKHKAGFALRKYAYSQ